MIIIGSRAMFVNLPKEHNQDARVRRADYDVLMTPDEFASWQQTHQGKIVVLDRPENKFKAYVKRPGKDIAYEIEVGEPGTSAEFLLKYVSQVCSGTVQGALGETFHALNLRHLFLTKKSHIVYPVHFKKNIADYHLLKSVVGNFETTDEEKEYYTLRSQEAKTRYNQKTPKLNISNEDFFDNRLPVAKYFIHDDIHEAVKHYEKPIYEMMKRDMDKAWCEKDMFYELPYEKQIQCVQEEAYTIALERYLVPQYGNFSTYPINCYQKAVQRICTTLCSGWFRTFALDNYNEIMARFDPAFVNRLFAAVDAGTLKPNEGFVLEEIPLLRIRESLEV